MTYIREELSREDRQLELKLKKLGFISQEQMSSPDWSFQQECMEVCATVSDDQLYTLFGDVDALNGESRRNALLSQLLEAFSINNGVKVFDFSKLQAIGNGQKVQTTFETIVNGECIPNELITAEMLGSDTKSNTNLIGVLFDNDNKKIILINTNYTVSSGVSLSDLIGEIEFEGNGYGYVTCAEGGKNVFDENYGSFSLKTRAV